MKLQQSAAMSDHPPRERQLGFWMCLALVVGTFIGSGIFLLPAQLAPYGWNSLFGWMITIGGALCLAFIFARLSRALPLAAGPYAFVGEAFGALPAFVVAWSYWISIWVGNAAIAIAAVSYLSLFAPALAEVPGAGAAAAIALLWLLTAINCTSIRAGGGIQVVTVLIKLVPLLVVIVIAALIVGQGRPTAAPAFEAADISLSAINAAGALTLWALLGFEAASIAARNVQDPGRNVPRATLIGTLIVGIIYLLTATPVTLFLPASEIAVSNAPFALFVGSFWDGTAGSLVGLFAAISAIGALNGLVLISGEFPLALARSGSFPGWLAKASGRGIAVRGQLLSSMLASILIAANYSRTLGGLFAFMALLSTAAALVLYLACSASALRLQRTGLLDRSAALTAIAVVGILYSLWTLYGAGGEATGWGAVLLGAGLLIYFLMRVLRGSSPAPAESPAASPG